MERAEQDTGGRFDGGIFSGQRESLGENIPYQNGEGNKSEPQGQPGGYGSSPQGQMNGYGSSPQGRPNGYGNRPGGYMPGQRLVNRCGRAGWNAGMHDCDFPLQHQGNRCFYGCPECPKHRQSGQLFLLIVTIPAMGMLFLAFLATLFFLLCLVSSRQAGAEKSGISSSYEAGEPETPFQQEKPENKVPDWQEKAEGQESGDHSEYYGEIRDAVRTDLPYSIRWENYEYEGNSDTVMIAIDYPVIEGDIPNIELLNDVIADEIDYFEEYYAEYSKYMLPEEIFAVYSEGYVTYMDEEVMSVVFSENIYTDYWVDCGLYCVNIDMENGVILENGSILDVDDEFAIDFRTRCRMQNGDVGALEYLTDQEVAYYLTDGTTGIMFFTPLGMEIGLNCGEDYLTVTYKDYKEYLLKY